MCGYGLGFAPGIRYMRKRFLVFRAKFPAVYKPPSAPRSAPAAAPFFATPFGVWCVVAGWGLAHVLLRSLLSPVLGTDDMYENVLVQVLQPGYILRQPPLYEWLLWSVQQVTGPTIWSFLLLKYGLTSLSALFLFLLARRAIEDPRLAALCIFSYSLFYQFGWNLHEGVTHTVVLVTACSATAWAFLRVLERGDLRDHVALGLAFGAGLLSKHSYPLFPLALLLACLSLPAWRARLSPLRLLLVLAVGLAVYSPYLFWVTREGFSLLGTATRTMGVSGEPDPHLWRAITGLGRLGFGLIGFSVPLVPLVVLIFFARYRALVLRGQEGRIKAPLSPVATLLLRAVIAVIVLTAVLILVSGATYVKERHMHPLLLLMPIVLFADLARFDWSGRFVPRCRQMALAIVAVALVGFLARVPGLVAPDRTFCGGKCRHMKPYEDLHAPLSALGADGAMMIGADDYTAGNLRVLFPRSKVRVLDWLSSSSLAGSARSVRRAPDQQCLLVWEEGETEPDRTAEDVFQSTYAVEPGVDGATDEAREMAPAVYLKGSWPHFWKVEGWRHSWWGVRALSPASGICN